MPPILSFMNEKIEELLNQLREAIHEAITDSASVAQAMAGLEQEHCCPVFAVDVMLAEPLAALNEDGIVDDVFVLSEYDEQFLRAIKITSAV